MKTAAFFLACSCLACRLNAGALALLRFLACVARWAALFVAVVLLTAAALLAVPAAALVIVGGLVFVVSLK